MLPLALRVVRPLGQIIEWRGCSSVIRRDYVRSAQVQHGCRRLKT